jgi:glycerol-3-phosphate O-acyltransferase
MVRSFDPMGERDIIFIPVAINYDRVFEDRSFLVELDQSASRPSTAVAVGNAIRFLLHNLLLAARNKWHRFGYACVNFGTPVSLRAYARERGLDFRAPGRDDRSASLEELARELMTSIARVTPVVPVSLVSTVLVRNPDRVWSELELKGAVLELMKELSARGAHVYVPRGDQDYAITVGLRMLTLRRLVTEEGGLFTSRKEELPLLSYYASSVAHLFR